MREPVDKEVIYIYIYIYGNSHNIAVLNTLLMITKEKPMKQFSESPISTCSLHEEREREN